MFRNIIWDFVGKSGSLLVTFGISIVLTRLLSAPEFGIMALAMVIITFAHVFMDLGFQRAIIQQQEVSEQQLSTVYYINAFMALIFTLLLCIVAGPVAAFYEQPLLEPVFRVVSASFLLNALNLIPSALIYKRLQLKANSIITLIASVVSGIVGIVMAYTGYGVWSLVTQSLLNSFLILLMNTWYVGWWPSLNFKLSSIKPLWQYGSRLFASGIMDTLYVRLDTFIIGKIYTTATLGFYYRAQSMDSYSRQFSTGSIVTALFPYIARHQHDRVHLKAIYVKYLHVISFLSVGFSGVLFLTAEDFFTIIFTSRWLLAAQLFQLLTITGLLYAVSSLMVNVVSGVGNSKAFFRLEVYKKLLFLPVYIFGFLGGVKTFVICIVIATFLGVNLNAFFVSREIEVTLKEQLRIMYSYFVLGAAVCSMTWFARSFIELNNHFVSAAILATVFGLLYLFCTFAFKLRGTYVVGLIWQKVKNIF